MDPIESLLRANENEELRSGATKDAPEQAEAFFVREHSNRSIARALGVSEAQIRRDLKKVGQDTGESYYVTGRDGKQYPVRIWTPERRWLREETVAALRVKDYSYRAIANELGISVGQAHRDAQLFNWTERGTP